MVDPFDVTPSQTSSWKKMDVSDVLSDFIGKKITDIQEVVEVWKPKKTEYIAGYRICVHDRFLVYLNWGDSAKLIVDELPDIERNDEYRSFLRSI